jgi:hypothetical protein
MHDRHFLMSILLMYFWLVLGVYIVEHIDVDIISNTGNDPLHGVRRINRQRSISNACPLTDVLAVGWCQQWMILFEQIGWYFLPFQMSQYFLGHGIESMYSVLRGFAKSIASSGMTIIPITPLFYIWLHIDMVDWLLELSYNPWYQKHTLYTYTVDWEPTASSYPPYPFPNIICHDQYLSANVRYILGCSWCVIETLSI